MEIKTNVITIVWDCKSGHDLSHQEVFFGDWKEKFLKFAKNLVMFSREGTVKSAKIGFYEFNLDDLKAAKSWDEFAETVPSVSQILKRDKNHQFELKFEKATCTIYLKCF